MQSREGLETQRIRGRIQGDDRSQNRGARAQGKADVERARERERRTGEREKSARRSSFMSYTKKSFGI